MKNYQSLFALVTLVIMCACGPKNGVTDASTTGGSNGSGDINHPTEVLSADDQKDYLIKVAEQMKSAFKTEQQQRAIELVDGMIYKMDNFGWDAEGFENYYDQRMSDVEAMFVLPRSVARLAQGEMVAANDLLCTFSFSNRGAIFEANESTRNWDYKGPSDHLEASFKDIDNNNCLFKVWGEGRTTEQTFSYYITDKGSQSSCYIYSDPGYNYVYVGDKHGDYINDGYDYSTYQSIYTYVGSGNGDYIKLTMRDVDPSTMYYGSYYSYGIAYYTRYYTSFSETPTNASDVKRTIKGMIPERIRFTLTQNNSVILDGTAEIDLEVNNHYNTTLTAKLMNLDFLFKETITHSAAKIDFNFKVGNSTILSSTVNLPSYNVATKYASETYEEYGTNLYENWKSILNTTGAANAEVNVMNNQIQIKAAVTNAGNMYNAYGDWSRQFGKNLEDDLTTREEANALIAIFNKYAKASLYYGNEIEQAKLKLQANQEVKNVYDYYTGNYTSKTYYELEPVIYFPKEDMSFAFGTYFSENRFSNVMDMAEQLVNDYLRLFKYEDWGNVDF